MCVVLRVVLVGKRGEWMRSILSTAGLARASAQHPWRVVALWVALLVLSGVAAIGLGDRLPTNWKFLNEPESVRADRLLERELLNGPVPAREIVVIQSGSLTVDDAEFQAKLAEVGAALASVAGVASVVDYPTLYAVAPEQAAGFVSADRRTTLLAVTFAGEFEAVKEHTGAFLAAVAAASDSTFSVRTVGDLSANDTFSHTSESDLQRGELIAMPIALVVLVLVFGALVAAGIPLIAAIVAIIVSLGITGLLSHSLTLSFFIVNMITMIGLAVGIDYALFIVERFREERRRGRDIVDAITVTGDTATRAVLFSGITVVLSLIGILFIRTTIFLSLGLGSIIAVIVAVLVMLTLTPALLSLLGDRVNWPRKTPPPDPDADPIPASGFWVTVTRHVMARPVISLVLSTALLVALALPTLGLDYGLLGTGADGLPDSDVRDAYLVLQSEFVPGLIAPVEIVVDAPRTAEVDAAIGRLGDALEADPAFGPSTATSWNDAATLAEIETLLTMPVASNDAYQAIERLRNEHIPAAFSGTGADVRTTGGTSRNYDFIALTERLRPFIFAFVLGLSFILLTLVFRSIVVPIKAIIMNLLSVGAAWGLLVIVFKHGYGADLLGFRQLPTVEAWIPIFLFSVLFGLSMDYHVFMLSRVREHYARTGDNRASVAVGLQTTGRIITGAALIMVVVFSGFAAGRMVMFQQMGFGLAVAILLDATIVRSVLVPSSMALLGKWNWYLPSWMEWLPNLWVEGRPETG
ncbi:MAG: MMPL family transporter [Chloroflexi bacterium]|nr:MAG: MMPL family transporter [Chloroflexota bacterium]